ncbi:MAG: bifunctional oligoribonuclease/PAP phosphatase NrnA [Roseivirga sp.]|uniref:DHH family phosphoesterase n=1 Tax=Roseivirga sp. TaxID=1964215 RepID=UPI001B091A52|nr:bifunctional oligoribonuclease/PAP phosphatase NrnA [Roseivirga sp.]MBO6497615.1 bifunctional oligoribonuclease/PAP phosphatase NrnA [Roseivirga sp.]MBO6661830.1 bifunctional oligoribonuclease/PAP phosphatase NrnA [Roseivirga sp.]MBO6760108.1 bifunctional oligoribonuclease/PAP phosphatase NrnA [Roseivirga sp.]MBO6908185.1 bifunctional oligoribonuclease/PAP phosphatase NrnA [Roseivirga sp.]
MQEIELLKEKLAKPSRIVITTHDKPDADALGSSLGMANLLKKLGHDITVITPSDYPGFLHWMKGNDEVKIFTDETPQDCQQWVNDADIIFALDFSVLSRINELGEMVRQAPGYKVNVDHHLDPEDFADFRYWSTEAAATCELCYQLLVSLGFEELIDKDIAECLYAGIMTDTGGFRHPNTTKNVHEVVAQLIEKGADNSRVSKNIYDKNSLNRLRFIGYALSENLKIIPEYQVAYFAITEEELARFESKTGDTEGLVNYALSIEGVTLAGLFKESEDKVKISLRSIGEFPANEVAARFFNGGGHRNAAGGRVEMSLEETMKLFKSILPEYAQQLEEESKKV